jgi:hypothetical protein
MVFIYTQTSPLILTSFLVLLSAKIRACGYIYTLLLRQLSKYKNGSNEP